MDKKCENPSLAYSLLILSLITVIIATGMLVFCASIQIMMFITLLTIIAFVTRLGYSFELLTP
jgi:Na+:H+ antiporter, NhaC family